MPIDYYQNRCDDHSHLPTECGSGNNGDRDGSRCRCRCRHKKQLRIPTCKNYSDINANPRLFYFANFVMSACDGGATNLLAADV